MCPPMDRLKMFRTSTVKLLQLLRNRYPNFHATVWCLVPLNSTTNEDIVSSCFDSFSG